MTLNKSKGNMYGFVTHTWNPIKGKCVHDCSYCYMKRFKQKELRFDRKEIDDNLGENNFIFIGSSTDMFASDVCGIWIRQVLLKCMNHPKNKYLFQTKNPPRLLYNQKYFPKGSILCTTIETNRENNLVNAPPRGNRKEYMKILKFPVMITIEPIMDFDLDILVEWMKDIKPIQVNIGADSNKEKEKDYKFPEPSKEKVIDLIEELGKFTKVIVKPNLKRIIK